MMTKTLADFQICISVPLNKFVTLISAVININIHCPRRGDFKILKFTLKHHHKTNYVFPLRLHGWDCNKDHE